MDLVKVLQNGEKKEDTKLAPLLLGDTKTGFIVFLGTMLIVVMIGSAMAADK